MNSERKPGSGSVSPFEKPRDGLHDSAVTARHQHGVSVTHDLRDVFRLAIALRPYHRDLHPGQVEERSRVLLVQLPGLAPGGHGVEDDGDAVERSVGSPD